MDKIDKKKRPQRLGIFIWLLVSKSLYSHLLHSLFDNKEDMLDMDPDSAIHALLTALAEQVYPDA